MYTVKRKMAWKGPMPAVTVYREGAAWCKASG